MSANVIFRGFLSVNGEKQSGLRQAFCDGIKSLHFMPPNPAEKQRNLSKREFLQITRPTRIAPIIPVIPVGSVRETTRGSNRQPYDSGT